MIGELNMVECPLREPCSHYIDCSNRDFSKCLLFRQLVLEILVSTLTTHSRNRTSANNTIYSSAIDIYIKTNYY